MLALFAQQAKAGNADVLGAGFMTMLITVMCVALAIGIAIQVFFCLTLSKALNQVHPENRDLEPGQVWLILIPFFNLYWVFVITSKIPSSLRREFRDRGMGERGDDYAAGIGKWYAICTICGIIPFVNYIAGPAQLILWIIFWVKIAGYSKQLREGSSDDYDDEDDDRPRKRSRRRDEDSDDEEDDEDERPRRKKRRTDDDD